MNKQGFESLLTATLRRAVRARAPVASTTPSPRAQLAPDELRAVTAGASTTVHSNRRAVIVEGGSDRLKSLFDGFDFDSEGPGFVEFTEPDFLEAEPPGFVEFTEPDFLEAKPPGDLGGFGGRLG